MKTWKAESALLGVTMIWGATFIFTKIGLADCQPSLYLVFRFIVALVLCFTFFGKHLKSISKDIVRQGAILGALFCGGFLLQTYAIKLTTVSKAAFITGLVVTITPFIFRLVDRKNISRWSIIGVTIASIGLYIFTNPKFDNLNPGDVLAFISVFFWGFYITYMDVFTRKRTKFEETAQLVVMQYAVATPMAILAFFIFEFKDFNINISNNLLISLAFNAIMASFLATFIHTSTQKYSNPVKAALIFSLEPVVASLIALAFLDEYLSSLELIGISLLFLGVLTSEIFPMLFKDKSI